MHLILDLETIPDPDVPAPAPKFDHYNLSTPDLEPLPLSLQKLSPFPPPPCHKIVCAGFAWLRDYQIVSWGTVTLPEAKLVEVMLKGIEENDPVLVGMNTRGFDLPVLAARALRHGLPFRWYYATKYPRSRYDQRAHLDLQDFLSNAGASPRASLDAWARLVGFPGKGEVDGSDVEWMVSAGGLREVADYCFSDVAQTVALFLRTELLTGALTRDMYRLMARLFLDKLRDEPRLAWVSQAVSKDPSVFLLSEDER